MGKITLNQIIKSQARVVQGKEGKHSPDNVMAILKDQKIKVDRFEGGLPGTRKWRRHMKSLRRKGLV